MDNDYRKKNTSTNTGSPGGALTDPPEYPHWPHHEHPQFQLDELYGHHAPASTSGHYPVTCPQCRSMDYLYADFIKYLSSTSQSASNITKMCDQDSDIPHHCNSAHQMRNYKEHARNCCWESAMRRILQQRASFHPTLSRRTPDFSAHGQGVCCYLGQNINSDTLLYHCPCQTTRRPYVPSRDHDVHLPGWTSCERHYSDSEFYNKLTSRPEFDDACCQSNPNSTTEGTPDEEHPIENVCKGILVSTDKSTQTDEFIFGESKGICSENGHEDCQIQLGGQGDDEGAVVREDFFKLEDKSQKQDALKGRTGLTYFLPMV